ncbi:uncharacterized protein EV154DRAFT_575995 [Mucor mucedo]|uniref:uncharacterized protein n=1 Tax=Mucor mucedo TaxID=29922 RepID=UPI0022206508|nr:uncharacterized protein EV154DRAFT_575995 [Mucor mucedo]KAI7894984.1 hypothetical protein EV154DRAFT_575995 [Mucor mucedo]
MSNWGQLPAEILLNIIQFAIADLDKLNRFEEMKGWKIKQQYLLISKHWSMVSRQVAYKVVKLHIDCNVEKFIAFMLDSPNGCLVREITFDSDMKHHVELNLGPLFRACPKLISLQGRCCLLKSFFITLMLEARAMGDSLKLQKIPGFEVDDIESFESYGQAAYALKNTLEEVSFCDALYDKPTYELDKTLSRLVEFTKLREVIFHLYEYDNIFQIFTKIQNCTSFPTVTIMCVMETFFGQIFDHPEPYNLKPLPNVLKLQVFGAIPFTERHFQYIMHVFPNLHDFNIEQTYGFSRVTYEADIMEEHQEIGQQVPSKAWIDFLTYVSRINTNIIGTFFIKDYAEVFANFPNLTEHLEIRYGPDICIKPNFNIVYQNHDFESSDYGKKRYGIEKFRHLVFDCRSFDFYDNLPHEPLLRIYGPTMKSLNLKMMSADHHDSEESVAYRMLDGNVFNPIFEHCSVLKKLRVRDGNFNFLCPSPFKATKSLQLVEFDGCSFSDKFLCELSTSLPDLLQYLSFTFCSISPPCELTDNRLQVIDMPYTSFGYLIWNDERRTGVIKLFIKVTKKSRSFYYEMDEGNEMVLSSPVEFESSRGSCSSMSIDIRCFDIENLVIKLNNSFHVHGSFKGDNLTFRYGGKHMKISEPANFHNSVDREKDWDTKLQCLLISRYWSIVSRQVVYKIVELDTNDEVERFVGFMLDSSNGRFVTQWILTLKKVECFDNRERHPTYERDETLNRLVKFTNVRDVTFYLAKHDNIFQIFTKIQHCPLLSTITICCADEIPLFGKIHDKPEPYNLKPLPNVLNLLVIGALPLNERHFQYIMYLFPNLHHFNFHHRYNDYYFEDDLDVILQHQEIVHQVPNRAWIDFLTYVSRMRTGRIGTLFIKNYVEVFAKLPKLTQHLAIRYGPDLRFKPLFNFSYENEDFSEVFDFLESCVSNPPRRLIIDGMSVKSYEELPHESLLPIYGPTMKSLNLKLVPATDHHDKESAAYRMLDGDVFNPVFEQCLVLKRLRVTDGSFNSFDPSPFKAT